MRFTLIVLISAVVLPAATPAGGDWLVTRDGYSIETRGPWQVKGSQVIFTRPGGALSTLRLADVDLEASAVATAERAMPPPPREPADPVAGNERRRPILRLTDEDLLPAAPDPEEEDNAEAVDDADVVEDAGETAEEPVKLIAWESHESDLGELEITGSVRNTGDGVVANIRVRVTVLDEEDNPSVSRAFLRQSSLAPGRSTTFRAPLAAVYTFLGDPTFEISSEGIRIEGSVEARQDQDEETAGEQSPDSDSGNTAPMSGEPPEI